MPLSDQEFFGPIERALERFPRLRSLLPSGYPREGSARLEKERALEFERLRNSRYEHHTNLPLALHLAGNPLAGAGPRQFSEQILREIESFASTFQGGSRCQRVLQPLWLSPWNAEDPTLWSVIAHCRIACRLQEMGRTIYGFEVPCGSGEVSADIHFDLHGIEAFLDVEMWHKPSGDSPDMIRSRVKQRAERKAAAKFSALEGGAVGIVVQAALPQDGVFESLCAHPEVLANFRLDAPPNCFGQLIMIAMHGDEPGTPTGYRMLFEGEAW